MRPCFSPLHSLKAKITSNYRGLNNYLLLKRSKVCPFGFLELSVRNSSSGFTFWARRVNWNVSRWARSENETKWTVWILSNMRTSLGLNEYMQISLCIFTCSTMCSDYIMCSIYIIISYCLVAQWRSSFASFISIPSIVQSFVKLFIWLTYFTQNWTVSC